MKPIDRTGKEIKDGDIIDIHQTVNGCRYFVVIDLDNLDVRYYDNNHQGIGLDTWVSIDRKYEYDVVKLLNMKPGQFGFIESEIEVVDRISEEELTQLQIGSRSGIDLSEGDINIIIETNNNPPEPNEKLKEAFKSYNIKNKGYTEDDIILIVNKMVEYYMFVTKVPIQMNLINKFLKDNYGFFKDE